MSDSWKERGKAIEDEYFSRLEREALERLKARGAAPKRKSPVDGSDMEQITAQGLVLDRDSVGGVYFDKAEIQRLLTELEKSQTGTEWVTILLKKLLA